MPWTCILKGDHPVLRVSPCQCPSMALPYFRWLDIYIDGLCKQLCFADDASAGGRVEFLKEWWQKLEELDPAYGYHPNPSKTWLLVKKQSLEVAKDIFHGYGINITSAGHRHLGSVLGSDDFLEALVKAMISTFADKLEQLCKIAKTEPQAAYSALIHGVISKWTYLMRTTPGIALWWPLLTGIHSSWQIHTNHHGTRCSH